MDRRKTVRPSAGRDSVGTDPRRRFAELVVAYQAGRYEAVATGAEQFTRQWPDQVAGWNLLAEGCRLTGRLDEAETACRKALNIDARSAEAYNNLGNVLCDRSDGAAAESAFLRALSIKPDLVEARYNLGGALRNQGRFREAAAAYRELIARHPDRFLYHCALGVALKEAGDPEAAGASLESALSLRPDHAGTHNDYGNVLRELGEYEAAEASFRRAIELQPGLVEAHNNLGNLLRAMGDTEAAAVCIREALRLDPDHTSAWYNLAMAKKFVPEDPDRVSLVEQLARGDLDEDDRVRLHFALGKALVDMDADADEIFPHYLEGCRLKRKTFEYDPAHAEDLCARIAGHCTRDRLNSLPATGAATEAPIFVVGMPRSGTSLVEQILSSHERVHGAGERKELGRLIASEGRRAGTSFPEWLAGVSSEPLERIAGEYRRHVVDSQGKERVVDKMPSNFRYLGVISAALPGARIVHIRRGPIDTCLSCFMHLFNEPQPFSYELAELGRYYRAYDGLMSHWRDALPPGRMLEVHYEDLVRDPESVIRQLLDHCGLEWDPACLDFHENRRAVVTASTTQVRRPMYSSAIGRWRKYHEHLQPLIKALGPLASDDLNPSSRPTHGCEDASS